MLLFFDTETTGLPQDSNALVTNLKHWPRLVQVAWLVSDEKGAEISRHNFIIKPEGFIIPKDAVRLHGITTERAIQEGVPIIDVLKKFSDSINQVDILIAHNIGFDLKVVGAEFVRKNIKSNLFEKTKICTMIASTNYCQIPGSYGYKWPTLEELHWKLFKSKVKVTHNAPEDVKLCANCFFELKRIGVID